MDKCISGLRTVKTAINNVLFQDNPKIMWFHILAVCFPSQHIHLLFVRKNNKNFWHPDSKLLGPKILMVKNHNTYQAEVSTAKAVT